MKPSEILRPFFDKAGWLLPGSGPQAHDKLFAILDTLSANQAEQNARIAKLEEGVPELPFKPVVKRDLTTASEPPLGRAAELSYMLSKFVTREKELEAASGGLYAKDDVLIRKAEALLATPTVKPDATVEPAEQPASVEAEAREWAEKMVYEYEHHSKNLAIGNYRGTVGSSVFLPDFTTELLGKTRKDWRGFIADALTAFAARAVERYKASTAASEIDFADRMKVTEDRADAAEKRVAELTEQRDELSATVENFHRLIDAAQDQPKGTTSMDSLDTRIESLVKEKARRVYYQDIVYAVCNTLDRINRSIGLMGHLGYTNSTVVCGTVDTPSDQVQKLMREVENRIDNQKKSITQLDAKLEAFRKRLICHHCGEVVPNESADNHWQLCQMNPARELERKLDAAEKRVAELEKELGDVTPIIRELRLNHIRGKLEAAESEARRLRGLINEHYEAMQKLLAPRTEGGAA